MFGQYVSIGVRSLLKDRLAAFINIFGLALGLAACLLLAIYVRYETSYDAWLPDADRVYQVQSINTDQETGAVSRHQGTHGAVAAPLRKDFPQIEYAVRADEQKPVFLRDGEALFADVWMTEPDFFAILQLSFLHGDPRTALAEADSLVMSRSEAIRFFGTPDVLGRSITNVRRGEKRALRITGVFEDVPRNSHLTVKNVGRISDADAADCSWGCIDGTVYAKLRPGASPASIHAAMPAWEKRNIPPSDSGDHAVSEGAAFDWRLVNVRDVHLSGAEPLSPERPTNDRTTIVTLGAIAILILGIAIVNFVNLTTARAGQRSREIALRKVLGARRRQLIAQFLGEALALTLVAMLLALAAVELVAPWLSAFLRADLQLHYFGAGGVLPMAIALWLGVGVVAGVYPAFYLSRLQPGVVLRTNRSNGETRFTSGVRSTLVVAQFAVSIGLIACTIVIYAQTSFVATVDPGYRRGGLLQVENLNRAALLPVVETLIRETRATPGIRGAAASSIAVASGMVINNSVQAPGRAGPVKIGWYGVSPEFFETMGLRLLAGRALSRRFAMDNAPLADVALADKPVIDARKRTLAQRGVNIVVNRLAARQLGFANPQQAIGKTVRINVFPKEVGLLPATIVGVVEDARFRSLRETPEAMIFHDDGVYTTLIVRYEADDPEAVRAAIGRIWRRLAPDVPYEANYADARLAELYQSDRARGMGFAGFSILTVIIASLGLFGLAAFTAERRTKEIGVRKVFGASVADIVRLLAWQFSKPVVIANVIAWPVAWWIMRDWLNGFDVRVPLGIGPFAIAGLLALAIAVGTVSGHALRVARTSPIKALRYE